MTGRSTRLGTATISKVFEQPLVVCRKSKAVFVKNLPKARHIFAAELFFEWQPGRRNVAALGAVHLAGGDNKIFRVVGKICGTRAIPFVGSKIPSLLKRNEMINVDGGRLRKDFSGIEIPPGPADDPTRQPVSSSTTSVRLRSTRISPRVSRQSSSESRQPPKKLRS